MSLVLKREFQGFKFSLVVGRVIHVQGINSTLPDGNHIIMWDFDNPDIEPSRHILRNLQSTYRLPAIHLSRSHPGGGFHAYCLKKMSWLDSLHIVAGTHGVDPEYVRLCAMRAHWTLRLSDKGKGLPVFVETIPSGWPEDVRPDELTSYVDYQVWASSHILVPGEWK